MKRSLFLLGMAVAALSSCTNEDVVDVAQNRAIRFDTFVNNNTRAVQEVNDVSSYYLFGEYGNVAGTYGTTVFNNESSSTIAYWVASKFYAFGAYADGDGNNITSATFNANEGKLTFLGYTPDNTKDLIAAAARVETDGDVTNENPVPLQFVHMLSQVKFTFNTTTADAYTIKISDLKFTAVKTADGTYTKTDGGGIIDWTGNTANGEYTYSEMADIANLSENYTASDVNLVIPQDDTDNIEVTFTATLSGPGIDNPVGKTFTATLGYTPDAASGTEENTWTPGYRYNYTATINADDIEDELKEIVFNATIEENWKDADETTASPSEKQ